MAVKKVPTAEQCSNSATKSNKHWLDLLLKNTSSYILCLDRDGIIQHCSQRLLKAIGQSDEAKISGLHFSELYRRFASASFIDGALKSFDEIKNTEKPLLVEVAIDFSGNNKPHTYIAQCTPLFDDSRVFHGAQISFLDPHDVIPLETRHALMFFDSMPLACSLWDLEHNIIDCNQAALALAGTDDKPYLLQHLREQSLELQPDGERSLEKFQRLFQQTVEQGQAKTEWLFTNFQGENVPVERNFIRIRWQNEIRIAIYTRDLREEYAHREKDREAEAHLIAMLDSMPLTAAICDADGNMLDCNQATLDMLELDSKEDFVKNFYSFHPEHQSDGQPSIRKVKDIIHAAVITGRQEIALELRSRSGKLLLVHNLLIRIPWHDGSCRVVCYARDLRTEIAHALEKHEAEARLIAMLDATPLTTAICDADCNFLDCNQAALDLIQLTRKEDFLNGFAINNPEFQPDGSLSRLKARENVRIAVEKGRHEFIWNLSATSGEIIPTHVTLVRIQWHDGSYRVAAYARDLRAERARRVEKREAALRLAAMLDATPLGTALCDADGRVLDCNQESMRLLGITDKSVLINDFNSLLPTRQPDGELSVEKSARMIANAMKTGRNVCEWEYRTYAGEPLPTETTLVRIPWKDGWRLVSYARDLRAEKARQVEIKEANDRITAMLDSITVGCFFFDRNGVVIDCNQHVLDSFGGKSKQECIRNFFKFSPEFQPDGRSSRELATKLVLKAYDEGDMRFFWEHIKADGSPMPAEVTLRRIKWHDDWRVIAYIRDLSEIQEAQQHSQEMERLNAAVQAAADAKSSFLASMSHEIRTPMNAIMGMSDLIRTDNLDELQIHYIRDIRSMSRVLLQIINDILDFSKIEAGKMTIRPVHYDIRALFDNICSLTRVTVSNKSLQFRSRLSEDIPQVLYGDEIRVQQIMFNILNNAVKYTKQGMVEFRLERALYKGRDSLVIVVGDTGIGIKKEDMSKLFEKFEQFDSRKNRGITGTGLGLSITQQLVSLMDGNISVESEYGKGTTFTVSVPLVAGDPALVERKSTLEQPIVVARDTRILIVDDSAINLSVATGYLARHGFVIDTAPSGVEALEKIKANFHDSKNPYSMIFMDHMMPNMDGIETAQCIRALADTPDGDERCRTVPIIALTANAIEGAKETFFNAGMNDFISKPIIQNDLNRIIRKWLPADKLTHPDDCRNEDASPTATVNVAITRDEEKQTAVVLDRQVGLNSFQGDKNLYRSILKEFHSLHGQDSENVLALLATGDITGARRTAHTLKSTAAIIGAESLCAAAERVEFELAERHETSDKALADMGIELLRVLGEIDATPV